MSDQKPSFKIQIIKDGPYRIVGNIPLRKMSQHCSPYGEPLEWIDGDVLEHKEGSYLLCRCNTSSFGLTNSGFLIRQYHYFLI